jgi:1,6-anhydro-N-acetylmuramate kinase
MSNTKPNKPTEAQKERMVLGAKAMRAVDAYLAHINADKPRGRKVDKEALQAKIDAEESLAKKVILISQMHEAIERDQRAEAEAELEEAFLKHVNWFSDQHGITYNAWREIGVPANVLSKAGITS